MLNKSLCATKLANLWQDDLCCLPGAPHPFSFSPSSTSQGENEKEKLLSKASWIKAGRWLTNYHHANRLDLRKINLIHCQLMRSKEKFKQCFLPTLFLRLNFTPSLVAPQGNSSTSLALVPPHTAQALLMGLSSFRKPPPAQDPPLAAGPCAFSPLSFMAWYNSSYVHRMMQEGWKSRKGMVGFLSVPECSPRG